MVMSIHAPTAQGRPDPMVPSLFRARLVTMQGDRMLIHGFELLGNQEDSVAPVQNHAWAIQVMVEQPAQ
jgi:hypothetical protein